MSDVVLTMYLSISTKMLKWQGEVEVIVGFFPEEKIYTYSELILITVRDFNVSIWVSVSRHGFGLSPESDRSS